MSSDKQKLSVTAASSLDAQNNARLTVFAELFEPDKNRLYSYIYAYVMNHAAADDIFQETSMTLWREFDKFELGTNFSKWANGIAFNRIRDYRRSNKKYALGLSDDFLQEFNHTLTFDDEYLKQSPQKWDHLQACFDLLPTKLKNLYIQFYIDNLKAQDIVEITGRSIFGIRKSIQKLRKKLFDCVDNQYQKGEQ